MQKALTVAKRELGGYFFSPMAYVIGSLFLLTTGAWFFREILRTGQEGSLRALFEIVAKAMVFGAPLLTMRLVSEEYRSGTIEKLLTAPLTEPEIIVGKFLGVMGFYAVLLATTLVFLAILAAYVRPDPGVAVMGYVGMFLLGAAFLSVGLFTSCITKYQIVAAVVSVAILAPVTFTSWMTTGEFRVWGVYVADWVGPMRHLGYFVQGSLDTRGIVYFLTVSASFLFFSVKALESRRWR